MFHQDLLAFQSIIHWFMVF